MVGVAVRRLAFDAEATAERAKYVWARLRGFRVPPPAEAGPSRLRALTWPLEPRSVPSMSMAMRRGLGSGAVLPENGNGIAGAV